MKGLLRRLAKGKGQIDVKMLVGAVVVAVLVTAIVPSFDALTGAASETEAIEILEGKGYWVLARGDYYVPADLDPRANNTYDLGSDSPTLQDLRLDEAVYVGDDDRIYFGSSQDMSFTWSDSATRFRLYDTGAEPVFEYYAPEVRQGEFTMYQSDTYELPQYPILNLNQLDTGEAAIRFWRQGNPTQAAMLGLPASQTHKHFFFGWDAYRNPMVISELGYVGIGGLGVEDHAAAQLEVRGVDDIYQLLVKGIPGQTTPYFEIQDSGGAPLLTVDGHGSLGLNNHWLANVNTIQGAGDLFITPQNAADKYIALQARDHGAGALQDVLRIGSAAIPYAQFAADTQVGFYGVSVVSQQPHIEDADGTLADLTTKFNTLLAELEAYGLLATE